MIDPVLCNWSYLLSRKHHYFLWHFFKMGLPAPASDPWSPSCLCLAMVVTWVNTFPTGLPLQSPSSTQFSCGSFREIQKNHRRPGFFIFFFWLDNCRSKNGRWFCLLSPHTKRATCWAVYLNNHCLSSNHSRWAVNMHSKWPASHCWSSGGWVASYEPLRAFCVESGHSWLLGSMNGYLLAPSVLHQGLIQELGARHACG